MVDAYIVGTPRGVSTPFDGQWLERCDGPGRIVATADRARARKFASREEAARFIAEAGLAEEFAFIISDEDDPRYAEQHLAEVVHRLRGRSTPAPSVEVGKLLRPGITEHPEMVAYAYTREGHALQLFIKSPKPSEIAAVRADEVELALVVEGAVIVLLFRFGAEVPWLASPYTVHSLEEHLWQPPPEAADPNQRTILDVILTDAETGIVRATREVALPPRFAAPLHAAIRAQKAMPWDPDRYRAELEALFDRYPTPIKLLKIASARTIGGY